MISSSPKQAEQAKQAALQNFLSKERDTSAAEAWQAEQAQELQAGLMAYYLGRKAGEDASNSSNNVFQEIVAGVTPLLNNMGDQWDNFVSNITPQSEEKGPLLGSTGFNDALLAIQMTVVLLDDILFNAKLTQATNNLKQSLEGNPVYNAINNYSSFVAGATFQYLDDMSFGLFGNTLHVNWENGNEAFQTGMEFGRTASTIQGIVEVALGGAMLLSGISLIPPTAGGTAACAAATGPGAVFCFGAGLPALAVEGAAVVGGLVLGGHGGAVVWNNADKPLQIKGDSGDSSIPKAGDPVPGKSGIKYTDTATSGKNAVEYEIRVTGKPYPNLEIVIENVPDTPKNKVRFDWYDGDILIDAKYAEGAGYDFSLGAGWQENIKAQLLDEADRQIKALNSTDQFTGIEWWVSNKDVADQFQLLLNKNGLDTITVLWKP